MQSDTKNIPAAIKWDKIPTEMEVQEKEFKSRSCLEFLGRQKGCTQSHVA